MAHNVLYYNPDDGAITQFSNTDIAQLSEYVLELMAANTYAGTITVGTSNPIGTFTDTVRQGGVGSNNVTVLSNTYTLSQVNAVQSTVDPPMYLGLQANSTNVVLQENLTTLNDLADEIIQSLVSDYGVNSYYLGVNPPSDGGTWVSRGALTDTLENFTITNSDYRLWHKVASAAYTNYKAPLKLGSFSEILQWTTADVQNLIKKVEERIVATSIGTYRLQTSSPASGTWVSAGEISDVRRLVNTNPSYIGQAEYSGTFDVGSFTGTTNINYSGTANYISDIEYSGVAPGLSYAGPSNFSSSILYTGTTTTSYAGPASFSSDVLYTGTTTTSYAGPVTYTADVNTYTAISFIQYLGSDYTGTQLYTGDNALEFNGLWQGAGFDSYTGQEFISFNISYLGPTNYTREEFYQAEYINESLLYTVSYISSTPGPPVGYQEDGPNPFGGLVQYTTLFPNAGVYTAPTVDYTGFGGPNPTGVYTGDFDYIGPAFIFFTGPPAPLIYTGPGSPGPDQSFEQIFGVLFLNNFVTIQLYNNDPAGIGEFYVSDYTGAVPYWAPATYTSSYSGASTFSGTGIFADTANYSAPTPIEYIGPSTFINPDGQSFADAVPAVYTSSSTFINPDGQSFTGPGPVTYTGTQSFLNPDGQSFTGTVPAVYTSSSTFINPEVYTGTFSANYTGPTDYVGPEAVFTGSYTGAVTYVGLVAQSYEGPTYTNENTSYVGAPIVESTTETISTVTLWKRVA